MLQKYGDDPTTDLKLRKWQEMVVRKKFLKCAIISAHKSGKINLQKISVDSSFIHAKKVGEMIGFNGFKKIMSMKLYVAMESNLMIYDNTDL